MEIKPGEAVKVQVEVRGASIQVFAGDRKEPLLSWTDPNAFLNGRVGLRANSRDWQFTDLLVEPIGR
ncbi:hypothetical protein D3C85_1875910 [compost metagenome]